MAASLSRDALRIFQAALKAADPAQAVLRHVSLARNGVTAGHSVTAGHELLAGQHRYRLDKFRNIYVIGAGKAGAEMAQAIERLLGKRIVGGLINIKYGHAARLRRIELNECGHPIPDLNGELG